MTCIAIIPARGGSVRCPRKNVRPFFGRPMISYSIETALACELFDHVIVSTDDDEIREVSRAHGATVFMRDNPALEHVGTQEIARHVILQHGMLEGNDTVCVVYATVPMLTASDLHRASRVLRANRSSYTLGVGAEPLRDAGMFYFGHVWAFLSRMPLVGETTSMIPVPEERICDINTEDDWQRAKQMYRTIHA